MRPSCTTCRHVQTQPDPQRASVQLICWYDPPTPVPLFGPDGRLINIIGIRPPVAVSCCCAHHEPQAIVQ